MHQENAVTAIDALLGNKQVGEKVVIVGGDRIGCEAAQFLAEKKKKVTILAASDSVANEIYFVAFLS